MVLAQLFGVIFIVNLLTIGGGYVMLPVLHDFFVERFAWLTNREFLDAVALGQLSPGPLTIMNAFIGFKVMGFPGALIATVATYMPSLIVVTLVAKYYLEFKNAKAVSSAFSGIKPAVVGMLASVALTLGKASMVDPETIMIGLACFCLTSFTKVDPTLVIIGAGAAGAVFL